MSGHFNIRLDTGYWNYPDIRLIYNAGYLVICWISNVVQISGPTLLKNIKNSPIKISVLKNTLPYPCLQLISETNSTNFYSWNSNIRNKCGQSLLLYAGLLSIHLVNIFHHSPAQDFFRCKDTFYTFSEHFSLFASLEFLLQ